MHVDELFPNQNRHVRDLLGLYITKRRTELGLSIEQLSIQVAITQTTFSKIEAGQIKITAEVFDKLQETLVFDLEDLAEIGRIAGIIYINELSHTLSPNYPT